MKARAVDAGPRAPADSLARLMAERVKGCTELYRRCENAAQQRLDALGSPRHGTTLRVEGALRLAPRALLPPDEEGYARLRRLDTRLRTIEAAFPQAGTDIEVCRLTCANNYSPRTPPRKSRSRRRVRPSSSPKGRRQT